AGRRRALHARRRGRAVPQRRMRLLPRLDFERHLVEAVELAVKVERAALQAAHDHLERFGEHSWRLIRIDAVVARLDRRDAAADAELEAPAAHLVEHADFLDQAERMIERQRVDYRPEAEPPPAQRDRG